MKETDEPENKNVFRYIFKLGFGVYNWNVVDERNLEYCLNIRRKGK